MRWRGLLGFRVACRSWLMPLIAGVGLGACAQSGPDDSQIVNDWLASAPRRIAVTAESAAGPSTLVRLETSTVAEGAGKGAAGGALIGAGSVLGALVASPPFGWVLLAFPPTWAVIGGAGVAGAAVGGVAGAATAEPIVETEPISTVAGGSAVLRDFAVPPDFDRQLRDATVATLQGRSRHESDAIEAADCDLRSVLEERPDLDGVLAVNIDTLGLVLDKGDEAESDPEAALYLIAKSQARLRIGARTATVAPKRHTYETGRYRLSEWRQAGGQRVAEEIAQASDALAGEIVQDYADGKVTAWLSRDSDATAIAAAVDERAASDVADRADSLDIEALAAPAAADGTEAAGRPASEARAERRDGYWVASDGAWNLELHIVGDRYRLTGQCMEVRADTRGRMDADGYISATLPIVGSYRVFAAGTLDRFRVLGRHPICGQTTVAFARVGEQARLE